MKPFNRRRARECAVQALYSWQISGNDLLDIQAEFIADPENKDIDVLYFREIFSGAANQAEEMDTLMSPYLSRRLDELGQIERAILRLSVYELSKRQDIPYKVVINEAIELAKIFAADDSHKFVNGVLDKLVPHVRTKK